jgi:hypothetical protein
LGFIVFVGRGPSEPETSVGATGAHIEQETQALSPVPKAAAESGLDEEGELEKVDDGLSRSDDSARRAIDEASSKPNAAVKLEDLPEDSPALARGAQADNSSGDSTGNPSGANRASDDASDSTKAAAPATARPRRPKPTPPAEEEPADPVTWDPLQHRK